MRELRRVLGENKQLQHRYERVESERDEARSELQAAQDSMVQFLDKWQKREKYVQDLQQQISALQTQLSNALIRGPAYDEFQPHSRRHATHTAPARRGSSGDRGRWSSPWSGEVLDHELDAASEPGGSVRSVVPDVEKKDGKLLSMLRLQRQVARAKRGSKYDCIEVPVLSLAPRVASAASFDSHMSEKVAFQSGQLVKEQIKQLQRSELLDNNKKLFASIDMLVQVRLVRRRARAVMCAAREQSVEHTV